MENLKLSKETFEELTRVVIPICKSEPSGISYVGTGFFISSAGLFVTAKHVLMDVIDKDGNALAGLFIFQFRSDGTYFKRRVIRFSSHRTADISVGILAPMVHKKTGEQLPNEQLRLTRNIPAIGSSILTYAYPHTIVARNADGGHRIDANSSEHSGKIEEHHPNGRDSSMLPGPCYRTNMEILGGASGGPVFDTTGKVFGVNSTGINGVSISYVSSITPLLEMEITDVKISEHEYFSRISIAELTKRGLVQVA